MERIEGLKGIMREVEGRMQDGGPLHPLRSALGESATRKVVQDAALFRLTEELVRIVIPILGLEGVPQEQRTVAILEAIGSGNVIAEDLQQIADELAAFGLAIEEVPAYLAGRDVALQLLETEFADQVRGLEIVGFTTAETRQRALQNSQSRLRDRLTADVLQALFQLRRNLEERIEILRTGSGIDYFAMGLQPVLGEMGRPKPVYPAEYMRDSIAEAFRRLQTVRDVPRTPREGDPE